MSEITDVELEALNFTYGEDALTVLRDKPLSISISIAPHTGEIAAERYVSATLLLETGPEYPAVLPILQLKNPQGMSDKRIAGVMAKLHTVADSLLGEMMLGSLIEAAKEAMTEINQPEGHCIFCLEPLVQEGMLPTQELLLRSPCYHCYHMHCFAKWWHWQQSTMQQNAAQIRQDLQSAAAERLKEEGLIPDATGVFAIHCPICRLLVPALDDQQSQAVHQHVPSLQQHQHPAKLETSDFTAQELDKLMQQRQERARQFAKQQQKGGIVAEKYGTSLAALSLADQTAPTAQDGPESQLQQSAGTQIADGMALQQGQAMRNDDTRKQDGSAASDIKDSATSRGRGRHRGRGHRRGSA